MCIKTTRITTHTRAHWHTHTHSIRTGVYVKNPTEDMWSLLNKLCCFTFSPFAPGSRPDWGVFLWGCAPVGTGNGPHIKQAVHSHSLYMTSGFVSLCFKPVSNSSPLYSTIISPSLRCHVACTTARPDSLMGNTETVSLVMEDTAYMLIYKYNQNPNYEEIQIIGIKNEK